VAYQVLARKWRPQRFEDVIGQRGVTETLRNAIAAKRIAQSFVFSGPRGVGKTTTARILARALNCQHGPTADPCGTCDACVEIAQGRDMDVLEIDAATNTQVDKVRDVIIAGLAMAPVRDRYKIFIIDEVHRLSPQAFDALLKSVEEPPPHVVFMMATTEIEKVPPTIQSRSQVFELKTIGVKAIADQLRRIADAEAIQIDDAALMLVARAGDGSMRDAQSALDQVIAFAGGTIGADAVSTVLGLVRRDLLLEIAAAIAAEDGPAVFRLAADAVECGYDFRLVVRELARLNRDLLVISIDPSRLADPEIAAEPERERLKALAARFSPEDLMRAFDLLTKTEFDIRGSMQPRYHLEMALLRWIHLRKLVPLSDLIQGTEKGTSTAGTPPTPVSSRAAAPRAAATNAPTVRAIEARREAAKPAVSAPGPDTTASLPDVQPAPASQFKEAFLEEIKKQKKFFYGAVIAQAQRIEVDGDRVQFVFSPHHRALRAQFDQTRPLLETIASQLAGRKMTVVAVEGAPTTAAAKLEPALAGARKAEPAAGAGQVPSTLREAQGAAGSGPDRSIAGHAQGEGGAGRDRKTALREQALADSGVQAMLDVFAAEIKEVEEM
jgi:DNA polymerase-3 subunit gamma/tau